MKFAEVYAGASISTGISVLNSDSGSMHTSTGLALHGSSPAFGPRAFQRPKKGRFALRAGRQRLKMPFSPIDSADSFPYFHRVIETAPLGARPIRPATATLRSCAACCQRAVASDDSPREATGKWRACLSKRPPIFTSRCCKIVGDHALPQSYLVGRDPRGEKNRPNRPHRPLRTTRARAIP
jgi:hypothetical protein